MLARLTVAGLFAAGAALGCASSTQASPVPEPGSHATWQSHAAGLLQQLQNEYRRTGELRTHNEIVLVQHEPRTAFL